MTSLRVMEALRWTLRRCGRRSAWQPGVTAAVTPPPSRQPTRVHSLKQSHLTRGQVRFYSQDRGPQGAPEERGNPATEPDDDGSGDLRRMASPFPELLRRCGSPSDVLDLTRLYAPTVRQVSDCLAHMWALTKRLSDEQRRYELRLMFEHPALEELLQRAARSAGRMRNDDLVYALLGVANLGVPGRSRVVQTLLRTCQDRLNDFDEKCLSILASSLEHMEDTPNVVALKAGMRLVVDERLPGIRNVVTLQTMMRLLGKDAPKELKWKLEKKALSMSEQFSLPNAQCMISTMATMNFFSKPLLDVCSKKITENLHGIPFNRLLKLLQSYKELLYRDPDLLTAVSDYLASTVDVWTNKQLLLFLSAFEGLLFRPAAFMDAYAGKVTADAGALTQRDVLCVLKVYSSLSYDLQGRRQQFLDGLSGAVDAYLSRMSPAALLKAAYCFCLLGHFPAAPLERLLQEDTLRQLLGDSSPSSTSSSSSTSSVSRRSRERMLHTVDLCLRLDRPPLPRPLAVPASALGGPAAGRPAPGAPWLSEALRGALEDGDDATLQEAVLVEDFYLIDGVITKPARRTGGPAEEESPPAGGSHRIAVVYAAASSFCFGTSAPRGPLAVKLRHLKALGYEPVPVSEQQLQALPEEQRSVYLRGRIFPEHGRSEPGTGNA